MAFGDSVGLLFKIQAKDEASGVVKGAAGNVTKEVTGMQAAFNRLGQSVGLSNSQVTSLGKSLPIAGAAIAGISAVTVGGASALFSFAKNAAQAGDQIVDLKAKTGLGAESLTALKFAADQSGSSIEEASQAFVIYQNKLTDAAAANKTLFGIDAQRALEDQEYALSALVKLLNGPLPQGYSRSSLAAEVLGRSGSNLLATFDTIGPSFERFTAQAKKMGVVLSEEDVEAAGEFADSLDVLGAQLDATGNKLALVYAPALTEGMKEVGRFAAENRETLVAAFKAVGFVIEQQVTLLRGWTIALEAARRMSEGWSPADAMLGGVLKFAPGTQGGGTAAAGGPSMWGTDENRPLDPEKAKATQEKVREQAEKLNKIGVKAIEDATEDAKKAREKAAEEARAAHDRQLAAEEQAAARSLASLQAFHAHRLTVQEKEDEKELAKLKRKLEQKKISHEEYEHSILLLEEQANLKRLQFLVRQAHVAKQVGASAEARLAIARELELLQKTMENFDAERAPRIVDSVKRDTEATREDTIARNENAAATIRQVEARHRLLELPQIGPQGPLPQGPAVGVGGLGGAAVGSLALNTNAFDPPPPDAWTTWKDAAKAAMVEVGEQAITTQGVMSALFGGMTSAIAGGVHAWATGAASFGKAMKQILASALASIAAESAVRAIFEAAKGFAALFLNPPQAAAHFKASGLFIATAAAAGLAAKAVGSGGSGGGGVGYGAAASAASDIQGQREDNRTRFNREQAERDRYTTREDRRGETLQPVVISVDGQELGRALLRVVRGGGEVHEGFRSSLGLA